MIDRLGDSERGERGGSIIHYQLLHLVSRGFAFQKRENRKRIKHGHRRVRSRVASSRRSAARAFDVSGPAP